MKVIKRVQKRIIETTIILFNNHEST